MAGKQVSIYIAERDLELWAKVEAYARRQRMAVSAVVLTAAERFLAEQDQPPPRKRR